MQKPFVSLIANKRYQIGCTGQTVYVLDAAGSELAAFRNMTYAYYPALHPGGDIAAVFSNKGIMAIYSLSELRLITKFRVSADKDTQTDVFPCFSPDGKHLYHIEGRKGDSLNSRLSIYSTVDYRPVHRLFEHGQKTLLLSMEFDIRSGYLYLLGCSRKENGNDRFIAKLIDQSLQDVRLLDEHTFNFYVNTIHIKQSGFTRLSYEYSGFSHMPRVKADLEQMAGHPVDMGSFDREYTLDDLKRMHISLEQFWKEKENR